MNKKTIITILLAIVAMAGSLLEPMEIHIEGNLQHNRYD